MAQMKFTQCGCGNQVSHDSKRCPKCGGKVKHPTSTAVKVFGGILAAVFLMGLVSIYKAANEPSRPADVASLHAIANPDPQDVMRQAVVDFESTIKEHLKDPDTYQRIKAGGAKDGSAVCVEYRSKNSFGGMAVARAVLIEKTHTFYMSENTDATTFQKMWRQCTK